jgi:hypothetical protein
VIAALHQRMLSHRLQGARPDLTEDAAGTTPAHLEACESQGELALRNLCPRLDGARPGAGVQLARQPAGSVRGLTDGKGKATGGGLISRGHLYKILSNPIYIGRLTHKDQVHAGLHAAIVDHESWNRVQRQVLEQLQTERAHATTLTPCLPVSSLMIAGTE